MRRNTICFKLSLFSFILLISFGAFAQHDTLLYNLSMEMYDSIHNEKAFFEMRERGLADAIAKNDSDYIRVFRGALSNFYSNNNRQTEFFEEANKLLDFYKKEQQASNIYVIWNDIYIAQVKWGLTAESLATIQQMADYARTHNHPMGIVKAEYSLGQSYQNNYQYEEAIKHFKNSWDVAKEIDSGTTNAVFGMCPPLINAMRYQEVINYTDSVLPFIYSWEKRRGFLNPVMRFKYHSYRMSAFLGLEDRANVLMSYDSLEHYHNIYVTDRRQFRYLRSRYLSYVGKEKESAEIMMSLVNDYKKEGNYVLAAGYAKALANQEFIRNNREGALIAYNQFANLIDSAHTQISNTQLNQFSKQFKLKELEFENEIVVLEREEAKSRSRLFIVIATTVTIICLLLGVLLFLYIRYNRRLIAHNHQLYIRIKEKRVAEQKVETMREAIPEQLINKNELLFREINKVLWETRAFTDTAFGRDELASLVSSNRTYVGDAIRECTDDGLTIVEYINQQRLKYACMLLETDFSLSIDVISIDSGFSSTRTFFRHFKSVYDMTPAEYRKVAHL